MTSLTDPEENTTRWAFGISGGVFTESINVNSADLVRTFEYNAAGNLPRKIDRNGRVIAYGYDHSTATSETWYDDRRTRRPTTFTTAYNDLCQVLIGDGSTEYEYTYGLFGNLASTTQDLPGLTPGRKFAYRYDSSGRLAEVAAYRPGGDYVTTYTYDRIGRITRIEQDDAGGKLVAEKRRWTSTDAVYDLKSRLRGACRGATRGQDRLRSDFDRRLYRPDAIARTRSSLPTTTTTPPGGSPTSTSPR